MDPLDLLAIGMQPSGGDAGAVGSSILDMLKAARPSPEQAKRMDAIQRISGALDAAPPTQGPQPATAMPQHAAPVVPQVAALPVQGGGQFPMAAPPPRRPGGMMALGAAQLPIMGMGRPYG
jgi:hypothetical protein